MSREVDAQRRVPRWPVAAVVVGAIAVVLSYVPASWYGQRVVGPSIGAGALWILGAATMITGTVTVALTARSTGQGPSTGALTTTVACWAAVIVLFLISIAAYPR